MGVKIFALIVWAILLAFVVWIIVVLGSMPGKVAEKRNHPDKDAIKIGGWVTLFFVPPGWAFVLMWAYTTSTRVQIEESELTRLREDNAELRRLLQDAGADA